MKTASRSGARCSTRRAPARGRVRAWLADVPSAYRRARSRRWIWRKRLAKFEPLVAFLALKTGRPVRLILTLEETFQPVRRTSAEVRARTGFRRDGHIVFQDLEANFLLGAYADIGVRVVAKRATLRVAPTRRHTRALSRAPCFHTRRRPPHFAVSARRRRRGPSNRN